MHSAQDGPSLAERLQSVRERIQQATRAAGRTVAPELIVVTKTHPASLIADLLELGVRDIGENRHQEAVSKLRMLPQLTPLAGAARWHLIGQLQSNKARAARRYATSVHSVDRDSLVDALAARDDDDRAHPLDVFLQVNLTDDPARGGIEPSGAERLAERILETPGLELRGMMAVAPLGEAPEAAFARLAGYAERLRAVAPAATGISAGMSHDFEAAIAAGATHLRIGSAITGNRQQPA